MASWIRTSARSGTTSHTMRSITSFDAAVMAAFNCPSVRLMVGEIAAGAVISSTNGVSGTGDAANTGEGAVKTGPEAAEKAGGAGVAISSSKITSPNVCS